MVSLDSFLTPENESDTLQAKNQHGLDLQWTEYLVPSKRNWTK